MDRTRLYALAAGALLTAAPGAVAETTVPAYGSIVIADNGLGPHATWTYDGVLECRFVTEGPGGIAVIARVECEVPVEGGTGLGLTCPLMVLTRTSVGPVGGYASCTSSETTGVGTGTATTQGNLGRVGRLITCMAYVDRGVLVPPYTVTCSEPGLPAVGTPGGRA